MDKLFKELAH